MVRYGDGSSGVTEVGTSVVTGVIATVGDGCVSKHGEGCGVLTTHFIRLFGAGGRFWSGSLVTMGLLGSLGRQYVGDVTKGTYGRETTCVV